MDEELRDPVDATQREELPNPDQPTRRETLRREAREAREAVCAGELREAKLLERILAVPFVDRDAWVDELFLLEPVTEDQPDLPRGSVPYLACGVEEVLAMVRELPVRPEDQLVDLGSGLGRVVMLAHLLTGARTSGIEIQEHLVMTARARSADLHLPVSFVCANAAETTLDGSIFFLYAPFNGGMLRSALERLEHVARRRPIVLCTVDLELHEVTWLRRRDTTNPALVFYESLPGR